MKRIDIGQTSANFFVKKIYALCLKLPGLHNFSMIELHVWGYDEEVSIISPSCIASAWLLSLVTEPQGIPFVVIPSNNTHLSELNELPLLIDEGEQYSGFREIAMHLTTKYDSSRISSLSDEQKLLDNSLITFLDTKFDALNRYNLFSNTKNYENYTRKLFAKFFPFPMMYNQALKFYNDAQSRVRLLGLGEHKSSFLNFTGSGEDTQTEYFNSDYDDGIDNSKAISSLHERSLVQKSETKKVLRESRSSMKCLLLVGQFFERLEKLKLEQKHEGKFLFGEKPAASDILFLAYFFALTNDSLPDKFIRNFLSSDNADRFKSILDRLADVKSKSVRLSFRNPVGKERPNLVNEVGYWTGLIDYHSDRA